MRILQIGDPRLRTKSAAVGPNQVQSPEITDAINKIKSTLDGIKAISDENGNALCAPQVGAQFRIVVLRIDGKFTTFINPQIVSRSEQTFEFDEECFSFYNLRAKVTRHQQVTVTYLDEHGAQRELFLEGELAGLIQHEIDHLDGVFFLDRVQDKQSVQSIDYILRENPQRLNQVKQMIDYMAG